MGTLLGEYQDAPLTGGESAYDLLCQGKSYAEIARILHSDIFQVMNDAAAEAALIAKYRQEHPEVDLMFAIDQVRWAMHKARTDHGETIWEGDKGAKIYDGLPTLITGAQVLMKLTKQASQLLLECDDKKNRALPAPVQDELRGLGREIIRSRFREKVRVVS